MTAEVDGSDQTSEISEWLRQGGTDPSPRRSGPRRRGRRRWGWIVFVVVLVLPVAAGGTYVAWALNAPLPVPVASTRDEAPGTQPGAPFALALPAEGLSAISVAGGEAYLGDAASGIWAGTGTDEARPMASISKLITALVVLDAHPIVSANDGGPTITFDKAAHDLYDSYYVRGATIAPMPTGTTMTERDALATMLIPSAANYAEAVATWAFGSQGAFLAAARDWLAGHGLTSTVLVEPTGLDPRNTSTPADLIALGKIASADPVVSAIARTSSLTISGPGTIHTTNGLLEQDGITGLKTGNLGEDSFNFLFTSSLDVGLDAPLTVTGVILGGQSRESVNSDVLQLLDSIRAGFHDVPLVAAGDRVGSYSTAWGSEAALVVAEDTSIRTWSDTPITATMETTTPLRYTDGEIVGSITWTAGPETTRVDLRVQGTLEEPTAWWRLTHPGELTGG